MPRPVQAQAALSQGCTAVNGSIYDAIYAIGTFTDEQFYAGEIITLTVSLAPETPSDEARLTVGGILEDTATITAVPATLTYQFLADILTTVQWRSVEGYSAVWTATCTSGTLPEESEAPGVVVAGCDTLMVRDGSVVGRFNQTSAAYWEPGQLTENQTITIDEGKTAWVVGQDESGKYYKFVWACQYLWALVGTMGPNPDIVWNSAPLPTRVVE
ncbi:MAG: hypothetical protein HY866_21295 [Chloroflexi bacterium]|nr:hypothetical protein [Chloroflexota bacterium]